MYKYFTLILLFFVSCNREPSFEILNKDLEKKIIEYINSKDYDSNCNTKSVLVGIVQDEKNEKRLFVSLSCLEPDVCTNCVGTINFEKKELSLCIYPQNKLIETRISELIKINYFMQTPVSQVILQDLIDHVDITEVHFIYEDGKDTLSKRLFY